MSRFFIASVCNNETETGLNSKIANYFKPKKK